MSYLLRYGAVRSLPCSVKGLVGMELHAKTLAPPVLSPDVIVTQTLELLASVSARTHVSDTRICGGTSINTTTTSTKPKFFNSVMQFFY